MERPEALTTGKGTRQRWHGLVTETFAVEEGIIGAPTGMISCTLSENEVHESWKV